MCVARALTFLDAPYVASWRLPRRKNGSARRAGTSTSPVTVFDRRITAVCQRGLYTFLPAHRHVHHSSLSDGGNLGEGGLQGLTEVLGDHLEHLFQLEAGTDALGGAADVPPATPSIALGDRGVELVELDHGGREIHRHVRIIPAERVLPVRPLGRIPEVHCHLRVEAHQHAGGFIPELGGEAVGADHRRDPPIGVETDLRRLTGGVEVVACGGEGADLLLVALACQDRLDPRDPLVERPLEVLGDPADRDDFIARTTGGRTESVEPTDRLDELIVHRPIIGQVGEDGHRRHGIRVGPDSHQSGAIRRQDEAAGQCLLRRRGSLGGVALTVVVHVAQTAAGGQDRDGDFHAQERGAAARGGDDRLVGLAANGTGVEAGELVGHVCLHVIVPGAPDSEEILPRFFCHGMWRWLKPVCATHLCVMATACIGNPILSRLTPEHKLAKTFHSQ